MKEVEFLKVETDGQIKITSHIADVIWHEHYEEILDKAQIDYMVDKFQSQSAIKQQIKDKGYTYFLVNTEGRNIGYLAIIEEPGENRLFISKIYLLKEFRGRGYGGSMISFAEDISYKNGYSYIWLTVNKNNNNSIAVYEKKGFIKARTQVADIGKGFIMDDYIMEKRLETN